MAIFDSWKNHRKTALKPRQTADMTFLICLNMFFLRLTSLVNPHDTHSKLQYGSKYARLDPPETNIHGFSRFSAKNPKSRFYRKTALKPHQIANMACSHWLKMVFLSLPNLVGPHDTQRELQNGAKYVRFDPLKPFWSPNPSIFAIFSEISKVAVLPKNRP